MESTVELTDEEVQNIIRAFKEMKVKPKAETSQAFREWMKKFSQPQPVQIKTYIPKLPTFYGNNKGETKYDEWRYQVQCLIRENHTHQTIAEAIRCSLKENASRIAMRLGPLATVDDIIDKMDSIFCSVDPKESLLAQFYTARQGEDETVSAWGCRLEDILTKAQQRCKIYEENVQEMLRSKFWKGLKPELQRISGHKFDSIKDFYQLLIAMRELEEQRRQDTSESTAKPKPAKQADTSSKEVRELRALVKRLTSQVETLESQQTSVTHSNKIKNWNHPNKFTPDETIIYRPADRSKRKQQQEVICWRCRQPGHIAVGCKVRLDNLRKANRAFNLQQVLTQEQHTLDKTLESSFPCNRGQDITGPPNEVKVKLNGVESTALLDTGSTVSTISKNFYDKHCSSTPIEPLSHILHIECADGQPMPYLGYIEADMELHGISDSKSNYPGIFLVVPNSDYNRNVPILIGTNIMSGIIDDIKSKVGPRYLQVANLFTPWFLAFRCMTLRDKDLERKNNRLAIVKSAESHPITIPANSEVVINGYLDKQLEHQKMCAILQATPHSALLDDLDIVPEVITYDYQHRGVIPVHISNVTTRTVTLQPRAFFVSCNQSTSKTTHSHKIRNLKTS